jgi:hypothetical protein
MRAIVFMLLAGCGAQPNQPVLANAPRPNPAAVAGGAAAAAAAITLASPDSHNPEKKQDQEKKPMKVKENVPAGVLDRLDKTPPAAKTDEPAKQPAGSPKTEPKPANGLDFGQPKN